MASTSTRRSSPSPPRGEATPKSWRRRVPETHGERLPGSPLGFTPPTPTRYPEVRRCLRRQKGPSIGEDGMDRPVGDLYSVLPMTVLGHSGDE